MNLQNLNLGKMNLEVKNHKPNEDCVVNLEFETCFKILPLKFKIFE